MTRKLGIAIFSYAREVSASARVRSLTEDSPVTAKELIQELQKLPEDARIFVDVSELGFVDVLGVDINTEAEGEYNEWGVSIMVDDKGPIQDVVKAINA